MTLCYRVRQVQAPSSCPTCVITGYSLRHQAYIPQADAQPPSSYAIALTLRRLAHMPSPSVSPSRMVTSSAIDTLTELVSLLSPSTRSGSIITCCHLQKIPAPCSHATIFSTLKHETHMLSPLAILTIFVAGYQSGRAQSTLTIDLS